MSRSARPWLPDFLSWVCPKITPPPTSAPCVLSQPAVSRKRPPPSAQRCQAPDTFRPCRFSRLRRFTPHVALQVCCTLQPVMGFELFPTGPPTDRVATTSSPPRLSQTRGSYPSKRFPLRQPHCVTAAVSFAPLIRPPFPGFFSRPQGLSPSSSPLHPSVLPHPSARCSLGLCSPSRYSLRPRYPLVDTLPSPAAEAAMTQDTRTEVFASSRLSRRSVPVARPVCRSIRAVRLSGLASLGLSPSDSPAPKGPCVSIGGPTETCPPSKWRWTTHLRKLLHRSVEPPAKPAHRRSNAEASSPWFATLRTRYRCSHRFHPNRSPSGRAIWPKPPGL